MVSNFLGSTEDAQRATSIISVSELIAREGVNLQKGMTFRDGMEMLSVFLSLPRDDGFTDDWDEETHIYTYQGHDSTTAESDKSEDQLLMYESGRVTDNGKFYKAAHAFVDGVRAEPLQVQVYEKLDAGVWYDKGIFNLLDATHKEMGGRKVALFQLAPPDGSSKSDYWSERMLPASTKATVWAHSKGSCGECGRQEGLRFVTQDGISAQLRCSLHGGTRTGLL